MEPPGNSRGAIIVDSGLLHWEPICLGSLEVLTSVRRGQVGGRLIAAQRETVKHDSMTPKAVHMIAHMATQTVIGIYFAQARCRLIAAVNREIIMKKFVAKVRQ
jgi:hypothetical protein